MTRSGHGGGGLRDFANGASAKRHTITKARPRGSS